MTNFFPIMLSRKQSSSENSDALNWQQVSIQHFPLPTRNLSAMPVVEQEIDFLLAKTKRSQINLFLFFVVVVYCTLLSNILVMLIESEEKYEPNFARTHTHAHSSVTLISSQGPSGTLTLAGVFFVACVLLF